MVSLVVDIKILMFRWRLDPDMSPIDAAHKARNAEGPAESLFYQRQLCFSGEVNIPHKAAAQCQGHPMDGQTGGGLVDADHVSNCVLKGTVCVKTQCY